MKGKEYIEQLDLKYGCYTYVAGLEIEKAVDFGFSAAKKETKEVITDLFNHYNSKLKELTKPKLDRRNRTEIITVLEAKVNLLNELKKKL